MRPFIIPINFLSLSVHNACVDLCRLDCASCLYFLNRVHQLISKKLIPSLACPLNSLPLSLHACHMFSFGRSMGTLNSARHYDREPWHQETMVLKKRSHSGRFDRLLLRVHVA